MSRGHVDGVEAVRDKREKKNPSLANCDLFTRSTSVLSIYVII